MHRDRRVEFRRLRFGHARVAPPPRSQVEISANVTAMARRWRRADQVAVHLPCRVTSLRTRPALTGRSCRSSSRTADVRFADAAGPRDLGNHRLVDGISGDDVEPSRRARGVLPEPGRALARCAAAAAREDLVYLPQPGNRAAA
jgi:hypothetical protein